MVTDLIKRAQDLTLEYMTQGQELAVQTVRTGFSTVEGKIPSLQWLPTSNVPQPKELTDAGFDFAAELLKNQRKFANDLLKAASPLVKAVYGPAKPVVKAA